VRVRPTWVIIALVFTALVAGCGSPSPSPLPAVGVQPAPNPKLVEFEGRVAESTKRQGQLVQALAKASNGAPAELNIVARQIAGWAAAEMQWLDQHRPDACYMSAADAYRAGVRSILSAASAFVAMSGDPSPPTDAEGQGAGQGLSDGRTAIEAAASQAKSLRPACSS
jgi:hypothetical protein